MTDNTISNDTLIASIITLFLILPLVLLLAAWLLVRGLGALELPLHTLDIWQLLMGVYLCLCVVRELAQPSPKS